MRRVALFSCLLLLATSGTAGAGRSSATSWAGPQISTVGAAGLMAPSVDAFRPEYAWRVLATGPGHGIQTISGRLIIPVWLALGTGGNGHHPSVNSVIYSDDHGATWRRGALAVPCTQFAEADHPVRDMADHPRRDAVHADERQPAEDSICPKQFRQPLLVPQAVLNGQDSGVVLDQRSEERLKLMVSGGFERDQHKVGGRHLARVGVNVNVAGGNAEIAGSALNCPPVSLHRFILGAQQQMNVVAAVGEAGAVIPTHRDRAGPRDAGAILNPPSGLD